MSIHTAIRLDEQDHAALKALAKRRKLSITRLLVDSALGRLPEVQRTTDERLNDLEQRLQRVEHSLFS